MTSWAARTAVALAVAASVLTRATLPAQSVAPSLPAPTFPSVAALLGKDPAQALAALDREVARLGASAPLEAAVLRADLLSRIGKHVESARLWDDIASRDGDLAEFATRSAIAELIEAGDPDRAAPRVRALAGARPDAVDDLVLLSLADAYRTAKQFAPAEDLFRDVLRRQRTTALADRARLGLAACAEAAGDFQVALDAWHDATVSWRMADTFAAARAGERRVAGRLGRPGLPLTPEQYFDNADRLVAASHFDDAVALLEEGVRNHVVPPGDHVEETIIDALYRGRRNDAAASRAAAFLSEHPASPAAPQVRVIQIRLEIRTGNLGAARRHLAALQADRHVPIAIRQGAMRTVAAQLVATGSVRDGIALYRQALASRMGRTDQFDVYWRIGIAALRTGDNRAAVSALTRARKLAPSRSSPRSTLYWLAVALERTGDGGQAKNLWTQMVDANAYDYYGLQAAARLRRPAGVAATSREVFPALEVGSPAQSSSDFRAAMVLARAGLLDDTSALLAALAARFRTDAGLALLAARAASAAGDHATAWSLVTSHFSAYLAEPAAGTPIDVWQMAFPRAYWTDVQAAAGRAGVDPLLLLSLMRRESRFVVAARSRSGALGLFQIMPDTARQVAGAGEEAADADRLLQAPTSADLAARLVKRLAAQFSGATAPIVASYNAGEDRVADWWKTGRGLSEDLFVDSIPYGETRQYVREVLANYAAYKRLYGQ